MSNAAKGTATNTLYEWQTDSLADAGANAQIEGDDYDGDARTATVRLNNRTQISAKSVTISGTDDAVDNAGMSTQMAYQLAKMGKELKRDMERAFVGIENAKVTGNSSTARELASVGTWYGGNKPGTSSAAGNFSSNGSLSATPAGDGSTAIAGGSNRTFTETLIKSWSFKSL